MTSRAQPAARGAAWLVPLALVLVDAGCATRLLDAQDAGLPVDAGGDAHVDASGDATVDAGACVTHRLDEVPIARLALVDADRPLVEGMAVRVEVDLGVSICEVLGQITVEEEALDAKGSHFAVHAHLWRWVGPGPFSCPVMQARRIIDLTPLLAWEGTALTVRDGAPGGSAQLAVTLTAAPPSDCHAAAIDAACDDDCECPASAADVHAACLVPYTHPKAARGVCVASCSEDAECPDDAPHCTVGEGANPRLPFVCTPGTCADIGCPPFQTCVVTPGGSGCRPVAVRALDARCACDADCAGDAICGLAVDGSLRCLRPCVTTADCPTGLLCDSSRCAIVDP